MLKVNDSTNIMPFEKEKLIIAKKNGFDSYRDYEYSMSKQLGCDPRFSLNKKYYYKCQTYLLDVINASINYMNNRSVYNKNRSGDIFVLTMFGLNELQEAINNNNEFIINYMNKVHLDINELINFVRLENLNSSLFKTK